MTERDFFNSLFSNETNFIFAHILFYLDMCNTSGCGDLCTNTNTSPGYKCLCREGYKLDTDGTACIGTVILNVLSFNYI